MREKRTEVDFSKHIHTRELFKNENGDEIIVDHFKVPCTIHGYIKLTNTDDCLLVTGDYGNWIFDRPFLPSSEGFVSDGYWFEKLRMSSEQRFNELDWDYIENEIEELINGGLEEQGYSGDELNTLKEWFGELLESTGDTLEYEYKAYRDYYIPDSIDYEIIPYSKKTPIWLLIIFDAFDEMCNRFKNGKKV